MNYNIPVICSNCKGGNREIVCNGKAGFLFKVDDAYDLKNKIEKLLKDKKSRSNKIKFAKKHIQQFNFLKNFLSYEKIFNKI